MWLAGVSMEHAVAQPAAVAAGRVYSGNRHRFLRRYSLSTTDYNLVARVAITTAGGSAIPIVGTQLLGLVGTDVFGQGLLGAGLATLYFSVYAAAIFII